LIFCALCGMGFTDSTNRAAVQGFDDGIWELIARGWRFQHLRDDSGHIVTVVGSYGWAEYYDRLHIFGETEAVAARAVMETRPGADEIVWSYQGDAVAAIKELLELPKPHEPEPREWHAPRRWVYGCPALADHKSNVSLA
jgi:hypothetical protein